MFPEWLGETFTVRGEIFPKVLFLEGNMIGKLPRVENSVTEPFEMLKWVRNGKLSIDVVLRNNQWM